MTRSNACRGMRLASTATQGSPDDATARAEKAASGTTSATGSVDAAGRRDMVTRASTRRRDVPRNVVPGDRLREPIVVVRQRLKATFDCASNRVGLQRVQFAAPSVRGLDAS